VLVVAGVSAIIGFVLLALLTSVFCDGMPQFLSKFVSQCNTRAIP